MRARARAAIHVFRGRGAFSPAQRQEYEDSSWHAGGEYPSSLANGELLRLGCGLPVQATGSARLMLVS